MIETPRILAFAGSLRSGSYNKQLGRVAAEAARAAGAEVTWLDLRDLPLPLYNQDDEDRDGLPENARKFKKLMEAHHGFLIAAPEYNSSFSGVLKNAIDWASRQEGEEEPPLVAFKGKIAALVSASPGRYGGVRGLRHLRDVLSTIGVLVLSQEVSVAHANDAFDAQGKLNDSHAHHRVDAVARKLVEVTRKLC